MHPADIQAELKKRGVTQKALAREIGVSEMCISRVIHRTIVSDRIMKKIAETIEMDHRAVFPDYYFGPKKRRAWRIVRKQVY